MQKITLRIRLEHFQNLGRFLESRQTGKLDRSYLPYTRVKLGHVPQDRMVDRRNLPESQDVLGPHLDRFSQSRNRTQAFIVKKEVLSFAA